MTYLSEEQLVQKLVALNALPEQHRGDIDLEKFFAQWWLEVLRTNPLGYEEKNLNELCPQVEPMGIEEFLGKWWGISSHL